MKYNFKVIAVLIFLSFLSAASLASLFLFPYKALFIVLLVLSLISLFLYYLFNDIQPTSDQSADKNYSDIFIADELDKFFQKQKPYLNPNYKISALEKQLKVSRKAISNFTKRRYKRNFNQYLNLWRIAELRYLQKKPENHDISVNILCLKTGFRNAQQYHQAEKERKAINRRKNETKSKPIIKDFDEDIPNDLEIKKKPAIQIRT